MRAATISVNVRTTSATSASVKDDDSSSSSQDCQEETTDMRKGKRKLSIQTNFNTNKKVVRETAESHPPAKDELYLCGDSDLDEQIDQLEDTTKSPKGNFGSNNDNSKPDKSDENHLNKNIANGFSVVKKTVPLIGKKLAGIKNNIMFNPVSSEKLVQKLEKHPRPENLNSLKIKKCNSEIWRKIL